MKKVLTIFIGFIAIATSAITFAQQDPLSLGFRTTNNANTYVAEERSADNAARASRQENAFGEMLQEQGRTFTTIKTDNRLAREKLRAALNLLKSVNRKFIR